MVDGARNVLDGGMWRLVMVDIFWLVLAGGYILAGGRWWWVMVDIYWLVVGSKGGGGMMDTFSSGGCYWVLVDIFWLVVDAAGWWHILVQPILVFVLSSFNMLHYLTIQSF